MSQRKSEYARIEGDTYVTPKWVFDALYSVEEFANPWDCAPINATFNFLELQDDFEEIVTNPPFKLADEFCHHALKWTHALNGKVAMLLPHAFDTAKGRWWLFDAPPFKAKYTLRQRIRWENLAQKKNGPSMNHAWFVWDWKYHGKPFLVYLPTITPTKHEER